MIGNDIKTAADLLKKGEIVAIPTETVYGLAGNALNASCVTNIYQIKNRPSFNPLILHVKNVQEISKYAKNIPERLTKLMKKFMPGPLTLLLDKTELVPDIVTAKSHRVAIRIPNHPTTLKLLHQLDFPLAAPSANPFGYVSPTTALHVEKQLGDKIPYILDGGSCEVGIESTIVGMEDEKIIVYRKGGLSLEEIANEVGEIFLKENNEAIPVTPGMLASHYSPSTTLLIGDMKKLLTEHGHKNYAIISFNKIYNDEKDRHFQLSETHNFEEAARNLFKIMRAIDELKYEIILAELLPEEQLGRAINDRLRRAAYR